ncbi:MAG: 1-acyl-sn-glycerol-3-phosphate acyltransferase [Bryobacterales bacterium]|jgi:1-acyl-sn-glycerol-3-phosphate acyltransferase|nr:1-acyl-sn-glycerol-3-phosphate acyltransferase [Bryobacterales bacterium]
MKSLRGLLIADPAVILSVLFFGTLSLCVSFFDETGRAQAALARAWARVLLWVSGVKVRVEGVEHIDPNGSYIFIANHMSYMDTPVILAHIPVQFRFLAKRGLFKIPLIGTHLGRAGHIPVTREDPRASVKTMQTAAEVIQKKKISLLIFPEGGRSHDGNLRPFKEGGAYIAIRAGVPLIPVVLIGTREVLPFGGGIVKPGHVTLRILKPIPTSELNIKARGPVTDQLREQILNELEARQPEPQPVA